MLAAGTEQTSTFAGTWCWAGCVSHAPVRARVDSIGVSEATTVRAQTGFDATFLPAGTAADLATGAAVSDTDRLCGDLERPRAGDGSRRNRDGEAESAGLPVVSRRWTALPDGQLVRRAEPGHDVLRSVLDRRVHAIQEPDPRRHECFELRGRLHTPAFRATTAHPAGCPVERLVAVRVREPVALHRVGDEAARRELPRRRSHRSQNG